MLSGATLRVARRVWKGALVAVMAIGVAGIAGCDLTDGADPERGRALFIENCGECHALAEAGQTATIAPDLDAAFADARASGMTDATIEGVTRNQIANPRSIREEDPTSTDVFMPADLVTGQDAKDVSAYVGSVAGVPGIEAPELGGPEEIFVEKCGTCHTLRAAGSTQTVGPNLDEVLPGQSAAEVEESIVDPSAQITQGFEDIMPPTLGDEIPPNDLEALIRYLLRNAGQGGQG